MRAIILGETWQFVSSVNLLVLVAVTFWCESYYEPQDGKVGNEISSYMFQKNSALCSAATSKRNVLESMHDLINHNIMLTANFYWNFSKRKLSRPTWRFTVGKGTRANQNQLHACACSHFCNRDYEVDDLYLQIFITERVTGSLRATDPLPSWSLGHGHGSGKEGKGSTPDYFRLEREWSILFFLCLINFMNITCIVVIANQTKLAISNKTNFIVYWFWNNCSTLFYVCSTMMML